MQQSISVSHYSTRAEMPNILRSATGCIAVVENVSEGLEVKPDCAAVVTVGDAGSFREQLLNIHLGMGDGGAVKSVAGVARVKEVPVTASGQSSYCSGWALHLWILRDLPRDLPRNLQCSVDLGHPLEPDRLLDLEGSLDRELPWGGRWLSVPMYPDRWFSRVAKS
ncbi:hypothetical protein MRX96_023472 [Rhipicephalus microplus]